jgi:hypothetical protein
MHLSDVRHANRPKNIRIHLAISHVRFYLLRFNSSGNFCASDASNEKWKLEKEKHSRKSQSPILVVFVFSPIAAAVQVPLSWLLSDENRLTSFCRDMEVRAKRGLM